MNYVERAREYASKTKISSVTRGIPMEKIVGFLEGVKNIDTAGKTITVGPVQGKAASTRYVLLNGQPICPMQYIYTFWKGVELDEQIALENNEVEQEEVNV